MSTLILVRHGKASPTSRDGYDQLSEPGFLQSRALGEHWAAERVTFDRVYVGPRKRHAQTYETAHAIVRGAGVEWPEPTRVEELDEHDGINLVFRLLPELAQTDPTLRANVEALARGEASLADLMGTFKTLTRRWARGEIGHDEVESWSAFRARVERGLAKMTDGLSRGARVVAFTSAGTVAAAVGHAVGAGDEKVLDLSWALYNAALTEVAFNEGRWGLVRFNGTPHLRDAKLVTSV